MNYRGRLAPSPTGYLHLGHAQTFWIAQERARLQNGILVLREDDLDGSRVRPEFSQALRDDLHWFGFDWQEGPDCGGQFAPYLQSRRLEIYRAAFQNLRASGAIYPCRCSRQDVLRSLNAPHAGDDEPTYPGTCRHRTPDASKRVTWRFRVPDGETIAFRDGGFGPQNYVAGSDFGDFIVWRADDLPAYHLATVVDDARMQITEVVRGADLLVSAARQLLLFHALGWMPPRFYHCPLVTDATGGRLAKRHDALSLRSLRELGQTPEQIRADWPAW